MAENIEIKIKAIIESADASKNIDELKDSLKELESIAENVDLSPDQLNQLGGAIDNLSNKVQTSEASLERFDRGVKTVKASGDLLAGSIATVVGGLATLGIENEYVTNLTQGAAGAIALSSGVSQAGEAIVQLSQNTKIAAVAQRAFNVVANANPYLLAATALLAAGAAILAIAKSLDTEAESQKKANEEALKNLDLRDKQIAKERDFALALANTSKERLEVSVKANQDEINNTEARIRNLKKQEAQAVRDSGARSEEYKAILAERVEAQDELEKLQLSRTVLLRDQEKLLFNEQISELTFRENLLIAQGATEQQLFNARVNILNETIRLFGKESEEGIKAARELELVRAQFATNERKRREQEAEDRIKAAQQQDVQVAKVKTVTQVTNEALDGVNERTIVIPNSVNQVTSAVNTSLEGIRGLSVEQIQLIQDSVASLGSVSQAIDVFTSLRTQNLDFEAQSVADSYQRQIDAAAGNADEIARLEQAREQELAAIEAEKQQRELRAFQISQGIALATLAVDAQAALSKVALDGAEAGSAVTAGAAKTAAAGFPQNIPLLIAYGAQAAAIIASVVKARQAAKQIAAQAGGGGNLPSISTSGIGGIGGGGAAPTTFNPQQFFGLGQGNVNPNTGGPQDTRVFVVESDITNTQNRVSVIEDRARIG